MKRRFLIWLSLKFFNLANKLDSYLWPGEYPIDYEDYEPDDYDYPVTERYVDEYDVHQPRV